MANILYKKLQAIAHPKEATSKIYQKPLNDYESDYEDDWTIEQRKIKVKVPVLHMMNRQEGLEKLEEERKLNIARGSALIKCTIVRDTTKGIVPEETRCHICTLKMPCKHFKGLQDKNMVDLRPQKVFTQMEWKSLQEEERNNVKRYLKKQVY